MTELAIESLKTSFSNDTIKGTADVVLSDWRIRLSRITWKVDKQKKIRIKLPGIETGDNKEKFLPLISIEDRGLQKEIETAVRRAVRALIKLEKNR